MARYFTGGPESFEGLPEFDEAGELFNQEWEAELDREANPDAHQWPRGRTFNPQGGTIPSGPFQTQPSCPLQEDLQQLKIQIGPFDRHVARLRQLVKQTPRNQAEIDAVGRVARQLQLDLIAQLERMRERTRTGDYLRNGCTHREIARATCNLRKIGHLMCDPRDKSIRTPAWLTIDKPRRAYCQLVFWLRNSRGPFAKVDCSAL
jgi:hypothetical protein